MIKFRKKLWKTLNIGRTFRCISNSKIAGVICNEFWLEVKLIWNLKKKFSKGIYHNKIEKGKKVPREK